MSCYDVIDCEFERKYIVLESNVSSTGLPVYHAVYVKLTMEDESTQHAIYT
jgi:hypothetical protein